LVQRCLLAAREEIEHTHKQLELSGYNGLQAACLGLIDPAPRSFANRVEALCFLATESWVDGWHGEKMAVQRLHDLRDSAREDHVAHVFDALALEEDSHVRLSGDIVDWCVEQGGDIVRSSLRAA